MSLIHQSLYWKQELNLELLNVILERYRKHHPSRCCFPPASLISCSLPDCTVYITWNEQIILNEKLGNVWTEGVMIY